LAVPTPLMTGVDEDSPQHTLSSSSMAHIMKPMTVSASEIAHRFQSV
jgi:hypothetical protein